LFTTTRAGINHARARCFFVALPDTDFVRFVAVRRTMRQTLIARNLSSTSRARAALRDSSLDTRKTRAI